MIRWVIVGLFFAWYLAFIIYLWVGLDRPLAAGLNLMFAIFLSGVAGLARRKADSTDFRQR